MQKGPESGVRVFTIEEANALVPRLTVLVGAQLELGEEIQQLVAALWELIGSEGTPPTEVPEGAPRSRAEVIDITILQSDTTAVREMKQKLGQSVQRYREGWQEVQETGVVVKDTSTGLLDFYGRIDDRLVWLCWKYGEDAVEWYHELDTGFTGRKPLAEVRRRMLN
jgi:hypothetical protein